MSDTPHCYAVRRLNPFQGVVAVVEIDGARALSGDGREWEIQVEAERPEHTWGRDVPSQGALQFFRFGSWSLAQGLSRVSINPILDIGAMLAASECLVAALHNAVDQLPFPFADRIEHWLLDGAGQPLALLAATVATRFTRDIRADHWQAAALTDSTLAAAELEHLVRDSGVGRCWYQRQADGSGKPLEDGLASLPAAAFPPVPLRPDWPTAEQQALVDDYLDRLAPHLLCLDGLDRTLRGRLEQAACRQALLLDTLYPLYPTVLHTDLLDAARVEARLRRSAG
jgi:hypothetical protein